MQESLIFNAKIKIASVHFRIRAVDQMIQFHLYIGKRLVDFKQIGVFNGLLTESATLQCQLSERQMESDNKMQILLVEKLKNKYERIGNIIFSFEQFQNIKMKKFTINNCFDKSAYLEAFLLLLPTGRAEQNYSEQDQLPLSPTITLNQHKSSSNISNVDVQIDQENQEFQESQKDITFNSSQKFQKSMEQKSQKNLKMTNSLNIQNSLKLEKIDVDSLVTLNEILTEANQQLSSENSILRSTIKDLQSKMRKQSQEIQNSEENHRVKVQQMEISLRKKEKQYQQQNEKLILLQNQNENLKRQVSQLKFSFKGELKSQLDISELVSDLSKYTSTAKKYKTKSSFDNNRNEKLTKVPDIPIISLRMDDFFKQSTRSGKSSRYPKSITTHRQKNLKDDQTIDTVRQIVRSD